MRPRRRELGLEGLQALPQRARELQRRALRAEAAREHGEHRGLLEERRTRGAWTCRP